MEDIREGAAGVMDEWWHRTGMTWTERKAAEAQNFAEGRATSISCHEIGIGLSLVGAGTTSVGVVGSATTLMIPGVGEMLILVGGGMDLAGVAADLLHEKGQC